VRARDPLTVVQAARALELSEAKVRKLVKAERIRIVGHGKHGAMLLDRGDIDEVGRSFLYAHFGRAARQVLVHHTLHDAALALEVSGIHVCVIQDIMDGLARHEWGRPIFILPASLPRTESELLATIREEIELIMVGPSPSIVRRSDAVVDEHELRLLVTSTWRLVTARKSAQGSN
jgi:hypothetical protein